MTPLLPSLNKIFTHTHTHNHAALRSVFSQRVKLRSTLCHTLQGSVSFSNNFAFQFLTFATHTRTRATTVTIKTFFEKKNVQNDCVYSTFWLSIAISVAHDGTFSCLRAFMVGILEEIFPILSQLTNEVENASFHYIHKSDSLLFPTKSVNTVSWSKQLTAGADGSSTLWEVFNVLLKDKSHFWLHALFFQCVLFQHKTKQICLYSAVPVLNSNNQETMTTPFFQRNQEFSLIPHN